MSESWLQALLVASVERNLCTKIGCTTCGASEFRRGLRAALATATGRAPLNDSIHAGTTELVTELANVVPVPHREYELEAAVRFILLDLSRSFVSPTETEARLSGTWAGEILGRMRAHYAATTAAAQARQAFEDPANVRKRREEKKRLRQQQHQERLARQAERSRLWHANTTELSTPDDSANRSRRHESLSAVEDLK